MRGLPLIDSYRYVMTKIMNIVRRGSVKSFDRSKNRNPVILVKGPLGMEREAELFMPYGSYYHPPNDSETVTLSINGEDHIIAICATSGKNIPGDTKPLEVGLITDSGEVRLRLLDGGDLIIDSVKTTINANTEIVGNLNVKGEINFDGNLIVGGNVSVAGTVSGGGVSSNGVDLSNHKHSGVEAGPSNTGGPV